MKKEEIAKMSFLEYIYKNRLEKKKEKELLKKKFNSLSLTERNAYEEIIKRNDSGGGLTIEMVILPIKVLIYVALLNLASFYLLNVDIKEQLVLLIHTIFKIWVPLIILGLVFDFIKAYKGIKLEKELLSKK